MIMIAVVAIVVVVVAVIGGILAIGFFNSVQHSSSLATGVTYVHGTASGFLVSLYFVNSDNKSSSVSTAVSYNGTYGLYLHTGIIYNVLGDNKYPCNPGTFVPSGSDDLQNFSC